MRRRNKRISGRGVDYEARTDTETEWEEEGWWWERRERTTKKGCHTVRGENDDENYDSLHPELAAATASYNLEPEIPFMFIGKEAVVTEVGYTNLECAVFSLCYLLVLVHW